MARYYDVHPRDPQPRAISQVAAMLAEDGVVAYPTDSCYALGCRMDSQEGATRIRQIRAVDERHHLTLMCADFAQLGQLVMLSTSAFRMLKAATPGPYTFILPATREVPRRLSHPRKRTIGVRITDHPVVCALLDALGQPMLSSTLQLPGAEDPLTDGWTVKEELDHLVDAVLDCGETSTVPTTVVDLSEGEPEVVRVGAGDPDRFLARS